MKKYLEKVKKEIHLIKSLLRSRSASNGMTYVELIVVISIFTIMMGISLYSYGTFQGKIDIKNLANDIALKIIQAQKDATFGKLPSQAVASTWKPAYGVYFDKATNDKSFVYFTDLDNNNLYAGTISSCSGDCIQKIDITKGSKISG